ncbi:unnamed protein product [Rotaria sp. Silwood2]|nr:unnamed protein product [Rotaria sp. Silwood2]CAF4160996.1 unnamed protein product [Rotaria sp. Silwood2]
MEFEVFKQQKNNQKLQFRHFYNTSVLKTLKETLPPSGDISKIIFDVIQKFSQGSQLTVSQIIDLLLCKSDRNFKSHRLVECFIEDVINNQRNENDLIQYIENENAVQLILNNQEQAILMDLAHMNIEYNRNQILTEATMTEYFDDPQVSD